MNGHLPINTRKKKKNIAGKVSMDLVVLKLKRILCFGWLLIATRQRNI